MVILDDDHHRDHVFKELEVYSKMVTKGAYLIVCDTSLNGHPVFDFHGPGPWEAVHDWLPYHPEFVQDTMAEKFVVTNCPGGYLLRIK
jgi:cephalosporin hydroxylase